MSQDGCSSIAVFVWSFGGSHFALLTEQPIAQTYDYACYGLRMSPNIFVFVQIDFSLTSFFIDSLTLGWVKNTEQILSFCSTSLNKSQLFTFTSVSTTPFFSKHFKQYERDGFNSIQRSATIDFLSTVLKC